ncbi:MarR family winged helix-turn-helix transcriptional regulator [Candidatus Chloroploca sp. Khr17]|uniref:MarR family winged helix-turn-helix transcriptional regulator n=1 Tax=Candidatus Chloroploca sp. Khr17 TaxID=2496869 RepID=UPI00101C43C9|nr:MarR family transcriptional regulator [Candidatus Chloroploca sp. Khr17]
MTSTKQTPPTLPQVAELLGALNAELMGQSMGAVLQILQGSNLSMPRLVALFYLRYKGTATISELSEHLNLALGTTSQAIDQLVQAGLVERREAHDRRHKLVTLTAVGREITTQVRQLRLEETTRRLADLPPELVARLGTALTEVLDALQLEQPAAPH